MTNVVRIIVGVLLASTPLFAQAAGFADCPQNFYKGTPPRVVTEHPGRMREVCFEGFAVLHSGVSKTPVYVAARLNRQRLQDAHLQRTDRFYEEARLPAAERAHLADYAHSGFDKGHMQEAASMNTPEAMAQSFSLANMVPQAPENNRGIWAKNVEKPTRQYAQRAEGDVFVLTGPVYSEQVTTIGAGAVWVPKFLFKLVYDPARHQAWAFWVANTNEAQMTKPISYQELVARTGIEFLPKGL